MVLVPGGPGGLAGGYGYGDLAMRAVNLHNRFWDRLNDYVASRPTQLSALMNNIRSARDVAARTYGNSSRAAIMDNMTYPVPVYRRRQFFDTLRFRRRRWRKRRLYRRRY